MKQKYKKKMEGRSSKIEQTKDRLSGLEDEIDGSINVFHDKQKLKQYMTTQSPLQKILQGILHIESESKQNYERADNTKQQERKRQESTE
jgi:hypothetical protein